MNAAGEAASAGSEPGSAGQAGEGGAAEDPDDVVGRFLAEYEPVPNAVIIVNGVTTQTDADGYFTVKDVADEYQMIAALPELKQALVYEGVRTRHPIAQFGVLLHFEWPYEASVRGKLNGPGGAPVASELTDVGVVSDTQGILQRRLITPPAGFDMQPSWNLTDVLDVELWAIQEVAGEYLGYGRRKLKIEDGQLYGSVNGSVATDIELVDPDEHDVDIEITLAEGWDLDSAPVWVGPLFFFTGIDAAGTFPVSVPDVDAPISVKAGVSAADGRHGEVAVPLPAQGPWKLVVPACPAFVSPPDAANAVTKDTVFTWTKPAGYVSSVGWLAGDWNVYLMTTQTQAKIPDLSALGVELSGTLTGGWFVGAVGPAQTTDEGMEYEKRQFSSGYPQGARASLSAGGLREFAAPL